MANEIILSLVEPSNLSIGILFTLVHAPLVALFSWVIWVFARALKFSQVRYHHIFLFGLVIGEGWLPFFFQDDSATGFYSYAVILAVGFGFGIIFSFLRARDNSPESNNSQTTVADFYISLQYEIELDNAAEQLLATFPENKIFAFHGELGAGKTTFIKAICERLGVKDAMSSPSFSLVNEYRDANNNPIYHFDLYRLESPQEALDIGMEEYLYSGNYCFVEWPERAEEILPDSTIHVNIREINGSREITVDSKI